MSDAYLMALAYVVSHGGKDLNPDEFCKKVLDHEFNFESVIKHCRDELALMPHPKAEDPF